MQWHSVKEIKRGIINFISYKKTGVILWLAKNL